MQIHQQKQTKERVYRYIHTHSIKYASVSIACIQYMHRMHAIIDKASPKENGGKQRKDKIK